jgi:hypothetical protein
MAQAALSQAAFQIAYPSAAPLRRAPPRITYVETVYDPVIRTRAPYPIAMRRARRRASRRQPDITRCGRPQRFGRSDRRLLDQGHGRRRRGSR